MKKYEKTVLDFVWIWAPKAWTTWIAKMLGQHPNVFIPETKELHYFNKWYWENPTIDNYNFDKPIDWYTDFFKDASSSQIIWEFTPAYIYDIIAPKKIYTHNPDIKIIVILRNPLERITSHYNFYRQRWVFTNESILELLESQNHIIEKSKYYAQLRVYFEIFPEENIKVVYHEDLKDNNIKVLKDIQSFLRLEPHIPENINQRSNVTWTPKYKYLNNILYKTKFLLRKHKLNFIFDISRNIWLSDMIERIRSKKTWEKYTPIILNPEEKIILYNYLKEDINNLETLLQKDFSHWKI